MSGLGGLGGSSFAGGGLLPGQAALGQFTGAQNMLQNANTFGREGLGMSTMQTMADAGARNAQALQEQQMSQADAAAFQNYQNQNKANMSNAIGSFGTTLGGLG